jgi:hypothetical protein
MRSPEWSIAAPDTEKDDDEDTKPWSYFDAMQARILRGKIGVDLDDWLEENK